MVLQRCRLCSIAQPADWLPSRQLGSALVTTFKVAPPEKWKDGAGPARKVNENKALGKKDRYTPYSTGQKCKTCKATLHQQGLYCHG